MLKTNDQWVMICLCLFCAHLLNEWQSLIYTYNFFHLLMIYSTVVGWVWQYLFNRSKDLHIRVIFVYYITVYHQIICQTRIRLSKPVSVRYQSKLLISFQTSHSDLPITTTTMLMAGPLRCPGTQQYKVSSKIFGQWHISWCFLAVLFISLDVGVSPTMLDSNAFLVFKYKVVKITLAHSYFQSSQATSFEKVGALH